MTSIQNELECPICLLVLVNPVTFPCGHTYCEGCVKNSHFHYLKKKCPTCRKKIMVNVNLLCINLVLDKLLKQKYLHDQKYAGRLRNMRNEYSPTKFQVFFQRMKDWLQRSYPWIIIGLLLYHLVRVKINVFYMLMEKYKTKALSLAEEIKKQNSLDFKFLIFSQFLRILFSSVAIP